MGKKKNTLEKKQRIKDLKEIIFTVRRDADLKKDIKKLIQVCYIPLKFKPAQSR